MTLRLMLIICRETEAERDPFYARVLYSGQPVKTIQGVLDWVPLTDLINVMSPYVPENITSLCG